MKLSTWGVTSVPKKFQFCSIWNFGFHTTDVQPLYLHFLFADLHRFPLKREMMPLDFQ